MMPSLPKDVHVPVCRIYDYIPLLGKKGIKIRI